MPCESATVPAAVSPARKGFFVAAFLSHWSSGTGKAPPRGTSQKTCLALTDLQPQGVIKGLRHDDYPATFVETLISLGEWQSPHRIKNIVDTLWNYNTEPKNGLYELVQPFAPKLDIDTSLPHEDTHQSFEFESEIEEEEF